MIKPIGNLRGAVVVWLISYVFFLLTLANNFSASHDSIHYLLNIISGQHLFHQHHLLYFYYAHTWMELFKLIFPSVPEYYLIESFTAVWGSANLAVCYLFFRNRFGLTSTHGGYRHSAYRLFLWRMVLQREHRGICATDIFSYYAHFISLQERMPKPSDVWKVAVLQSMAILVSPGKHIVYTGCALLDLDEQKEHSNLFRIYSIFVTGYCAGRRCVCFLRSIL